MHKYKHANSYDIPGHCVSICSRNGEFGDVDTMTGDPETEEGLEEQHKEDMGASFGIRPSQCHRTEEHESCRVEHRQVHQRGDWQVVKEPEKKSCGRTHKRDASDTTGTTLLSSDSVMKTDLDHDLPYFSKQFLIEISPATAAHFESKSSQLFTDKKDSYVDVDCLSRSGEDSASGLRLVSKRVFSSTDLESPDDVASLPCIL